MSHLIQIEDLTIRIGDGPPVVSGLSFEIAGGERLALVGESGSGKSLTALSLLGLLPGGARVSWRRFEVGGQQFNPSDIQSLSALRGSEIGMIFQEPMTSLNPVLSVRTQLIEASIARLGMSASDAAARALALLEQVGISDPPHTMRLYPHELSGGMRQRVMIAMAMMLRPRLLVADEPTTALDVTVQAQVLDLMVKITKETGTSLLLITHDMGVVAEVADRVLVMRQGHLLENQLVLDLFARPKTAYARQLLDAVPRVDAPGIAPLDRARPKIALQLEEISKSFPGSASPALCEVSLDVSAGETLALVGESGSGKSTLGRIAARLIPADKGRVVLEGEDISILRGAPLRRRRARIQMIFQDPYASLDPRFRIGETIAEPIVISGRLARDEVRSRVEDLLRRVGLEEKWGDRYPHQLSGGQRQRVAIARALAAEPSVIVADEPTSALDVSIQADVLALLAELQKESGLAMLFITHDLAVVRKLAHRVAVMRGGRILELGAATAVLDTPANGYTQALLAASPIPDPGRRNSLHAVPARMAEAGPLAKISDAHWAVQ